MHLITPSSSCPKSNQWRQIFHGHFPRVQIITWASFAARPPALAARMTTVTNTNIVENECEITVRRRPRVNLLLPTRRDIMLTSDPLSL